MLQIDEKTARGVQKKFLGYCIIALAVAVVSLFWLYADMNKYIREELSKELIRSNMIIEQNTNYLKFRTHADK